MAWPDSWIFAAPALGVAVAFAAPASASLTQADPVTGCNSGPGLVVHAGAGDVAAEKRIEVGMNVELADPHRLFVLGPTTFTKADVICPPALRPASLLLIGMLAADGISTLRNIYTINRGYEDLAERLNSLGAHIKVFHEF